MPFVSEGNKPNTTRSDYLKWLFERTLYIDTKGTPDVELQTQVKLSSVYISLHVQRDRTFERTQQERDQEEEPAQKDTTLPPENAPTESEETLEVAEAVNRFDHLVLLGDPGSGKTTLQHYLAHQYAQVHRALSTESQRQPGTHLFPILLRIADYAEQGLSQNLTLREFLAPACIMHHCPTSTDELDDLLTTALTQETCLILLDGLDEVLDTETHGRVVEQINLFVNSCADRPHRFLITSRLTGYRTHPLEEPFVHYHLCEMNESQIHRFLDSWCLEIEATHAPDLSVPLREANAHQQVEGILRAIQTSPGVRRLARNPLMLHIIALIHRATAQLPGKRVDLYDQATKILTDIWRLDPKRGESPLTIMEDPYFIPLLSYLAYKIHTDRPNGLVTEQDVHDMLREEWIRIKGSMSEEDEPLFVQEVRAFLLRVHGRAGLLIERAPQTYSFLHLSFQEFYAGRYLVSNSRTRTRLIYERWHEPRWEEPILLGLGFVGLISPDDATDLLETAILTRGDEAKKLGFTKNSNEELLGRGYLFAIRCLGEQIPIRPALEEQFIDRFIKELICQEGNAKFQPYKQYLWRGLEGLKTSRAGRKIALTVIRKLSVGPTRERLNAIKVIEGLEFASDTAVSELARILYSGELELRKQAARCLAHMGSKEALSVLMKALDPSVPEELVRTTAADALGQAKLVSSELVDLLLTTLSDKDPRVRDRSAESLGRLRPTQDQLDKVAKALMGALRGTDRELKYAAAHALGNLGHASDEVLNALIGVAQSDVSRARRHNFSKGDVRFAAIQSLGQLGQVTDADKAKITNALLTILHHFQHSSKRPELRRAAIESLGQLGSRTDEVVDVLFRALSSSNPDIRKAAAQSLGMVRPQSEKKVIDRLLRPDKQTWVYAAQIESLGELEQVPKGAVKILLGLLEHEAPQIRSAATRSLKQLGQGQTAEQIVGNLLQFLANRRSKSAELRCAAVQSLGQLGQTLKTSKKVETLEQIKHALLRALEKDVPVVRFVVAQTLPRLDDAPVSDRAKTVLQDFLQNDDLKVRYQAAEGLVRLKMIPDQVIEVLIEVLHNAEEPLRRNSAILLSENGMDEDRILEALWDGFFHTEGYVRRACANGLVHFAKRFSTRVESIVEKLQSVIKDDGQDAKIDRKTGRSIRDHAFETLWLLESEIIASK